MPLKGIEMSFIRPRLKKNHHFFPPIHPFYKLLVLTSNKAAQCPRDIFPFALHASCEWFHFVFLCLDGCPFQSWVTILLHCFLLKSFRAFVSQYRAGRFGSELRAFCVELTYSTHAYTRVSSQNMHFSLGSKKILSCSVYVNANGQIQLGWTPTHPLLP